MCWRLHEMRLRVSRPIGWPSVGWRDRASRARLGFAVPAVADFTISRSDAMLCFICRAVAVTNIRVTLRSTIGPAGWTRLCIPCAIRHAFITCTA